MDYISDIADYLENLKLNKFLLVCGNSFMKSEHFIALNNRLKKQHMDVAVFSDYRPNPTFEDVEKGINLYKSDLCEGILAIGGGSAIDVAKGIRFQIHDDGFFAAIPTTAGSGSEATKFAVLYKNGVKCSLEDDYLLPQKVWLWPDLLETLPLYQRKATLMDAYCHAIESYWSVGATKESRAYCREVFELIERYAETYLENIGVGNEKILLAANAAGKAINITRTTAGHALAYKLTTEYGFAHGHAVALCVGSIWSNYEERLKSYILSEEMEKFERLLKYCGFECPSIPEESIVRFTKEVNVDRLVRFPLKLSKEDINRIYRGISKE